MKLSISNIAWEKEMDQSIYKQMKENGYQGLEIAPTRIWSEDPYEHIPEAKKILEKVKKEYDFEISSMQSIWFGRKEKIFESKEERESLIQYTKKAIHFAKEIGCKNLVFGCPKNRNIHEEKQEEEYQLALDFFREIGRESQQAEVIFAIEANPVIYHTNFINTTEQAIQLVEDIGMDSIKVNLDLGTMIQNKEEVECLIGKIPFINHVHISEPGLEPIQERNLHKKIIDILKKENYSKFISIEMKKGCSEKEIEEKIVYMGEIVNNTRNK